MAPTNAHSQAGPGDYQGMTEKSHIPSTLAPKDWTARWAVSLSTRLYSLRMKNKIDTEMRLFAKRMPE